MDASTSPLPVGGDVARPEATPGHKAFPAAPIMMLDIDLEEFTDGKKSEIGEAVLEIQGTRDSPTVRDQIDAIKRWQQESAKPLTYIGVKRRYVMIDTF